MTSVCFSSRVRTSNSDALRRILRGMVFNGSRSALPTDTLRTNFQQILRSRTDRTTPELYIGVEWHRFPIVPLRVGFSNGAFTAGIGVAWKGIHISYAHIFEKPSASDFIELTISFQ